MEKTPTITGEEIAHLIELCAPGANRYARDALIRQLRARGERRALLARITGLSETRISKIVNRHPRVIPGSQLP